MNTKGVVLDLYCVVFLVLLIIVPANLVQGRLLSIPRPPPENAAHFARWLASQCSWGVLSTISSDLGGAPFGNVVSFSDGLPDKGLGIPYFYLTTLDPTAHNAFEDPRSSFTISEYPLGTCGKRDPESPACAKMTLTGKLKLVDGNTDAAEFAQIALFTKHPEMKDWPNDHDFQFFKLEIEDVFLVNWFGGHRALTVEQYLQVEMNKLSFLERILLRNPSP